jgi:hypothetical protein
MMGDGRLFLFSLMKGTTTISQESKPSQNENYSTSFG